MRTIRNILALAALAALGAHAQTCTEIIDTLYGPDTVTIASGSLQITTDVTVNSSGATVIPKTIVATLSSGHLSTCLVPNTYTVVYRTSGGSMIRQWIVPSGGPYTVLQVEQTVATSVPAGTIALAQLASGNATVGQPLCWLGSTWGPGSCGSGTGGEGAVSTVFGRAGAVTAQTGDYSASQITNAVSSTGTYSNPAWLTALAWSKLTGVPSYEPAISAGVTSQYWRGDKSWQTLNAAAVTNAVDSTGTYSNPAWLTALAWSKLTGVPTTYYQTFEYNATAVTQRAKFNLAAGSNVTITPTDNGTDTTTFSISASGGGTNNPGGGTNYVQYSTGSAFGGILNATATNKFVCQSSSATPAWCTLLGSDMPNPSATTLGGVESLASTSHQWINAISTAGVPSSTQPAFSDISGSVAAAQLPNPSATTLGGIESLVSTTHQWIDSISTAGVPHSSQPAYSDLSGAPTLYYQTVQANATAQTQRGNLNFSSNFSLADSSANNRTTVDLAGTISVNTSGNAATATALASAPTQCGSGNYSTGVAASGAANCSQVNYSQLAGVLPNPSATTLGGIESLVSTSHQWINAISTAGVPSSTQPAFSDISGSVAAAQLPNPSATTLGGVESYASVSHQWINSVSTTGVHSSTQPAFSDISGSVAAAQLPNPSATTLGGVESYTSVSHQWINAISTAGVPSSTQPAFSDVSGSATASQLPGSGVTTINGTSCTIGSSCTVVTSNQNIRRIGYVFDGGGSALSGTLDACQVVDFGGTITGVSLIADVSGSATVDVRTVAYSSYTGASSASTITASDTPALSSAIKYQDTTLTGWTTSLSANTVVCFHVTSPATATWIMADVKVTAN
jgi:hypothetical protein